MPKINPSDASWEPVSHPNQITFERPEPLIYINVKVGKWVYDGLPPTEERIKIPFLQIDEKRLFPEEAAIAQAFLESTQSPIVAVARGGELAVTLYGDESRFHIARLKGGEAASFPLKPRFSLGEYVCFPKQGIGGVVQGVEWRDSKRASTLLLSRLVQFFYSIRFDDKESNQWVGEDSLEEF